MTINGIRFTQIQNAGNASVSLVQSFRVNKGDVLEWNSGNGGTIVQNRLYPSV